MQGFFYRARFVLLVCMIGGVYGDEVCADTEVNIPSHSTTNLLHFSVTNSINDLRQKVSSSRYRSLTGKSQTDIVTKFNLYAARHASVSRVVPCSDLTSSEIASLAQKLKSLTDDKVRLLFPEADGRQVYLDPVVASLFDTPALHDLQCTETMKLWAHHIPESVKQDSNISFVLPTVPIVNVTELIKENQHFNRTVSCIAGHTVLESELTDEEGDADVTDWPHWPRNVHFRAKGKGPYPFWQFGPNYGDRPAKVWPVIQTNEEMYSTGGYLEVWSSTPKRATKFYHSNCVWYNLNHAELGQSPCVAIHVGIFASSTHPTQPHGKWYLFEANTPSTGSRFCCEASFSIPSINQALGTLNRKFMDNMKYVGNVSFHGHYYDGIAKQYVLAMEAPTGEPAFELEPRLPIEVWYETDLEGRPLRFAEIGSDRRYLEDKNLLNSDLPLIYEEMDPTSFSSEPISDDVFQLPEECMVEHLSDCSR